MRRPTCAWSGPCRSRFGLCLRRSDMAQVTEFGTDSTGAVVDLAQRLCVAFLSNLSLSSIARTRHPRHRIELV